MATCPHCKGHLTDSHRCPRRPSLMAVRILLGAVAGGLAGLLLVAAVDPRGEITSFDTIAMVVGAAVGVFIERAFRSKRLS